VNEDGQRKVCGSHPFDREKPKGWGTATRAGMKIGDEEKSLQKRFA
jgi:hypothetical protein